MVIIAYVADECSCILFGSVSAQNVLKKRDQVQAEYEAKLEAVAFRKDERTGVSVLSYEELRMRHARSY